MLVIPPLLTPLCTLPSYESIDYLILLVRTDGDPLIGPLDVSKGKQLTRSGTDREDVPVQQLVGDIGVSKDLDALLDRDVGDEGASGNLGHLVFFWYVFEGGECVGCKEKKGGRGAIEFFLYV